MATKGYSRMLGCQKAQVGPHAADEGMGAPKKDRLSTTRAAPEHGGPSQSGPKNRECCLLETSPRARAENRVNP